MRKYHWCNQHILQNTALVKEFPFWEHLYPFWDECETGSRQVFNTFQDWPTNSHISGKFRRALLIGKAVCGPI